MKREPLTKDFLCVISSICSFLFIFIYLFLCFYCVKANLYSSMNKKFSKSKNILQALQLYG